MFGTLVGLIIGTIFGFILCSIFMTSNINETAQWIDQTDAYKPHYGYYKCTHCESYSERAYSYCPVCGKFMTKIISGKEV